MGQRLINFCDVCTTEDDTVAFRSLTIDKNKPRGQDACEQCWTRLLTAIAAVWSGAKTVKDAPATPVVEAGRRIAHPKDQHTEGELEALRAWAEARGVRVPLRGRVAVDVWQAYYDDDTSNLAAERFIGYRAA